MNIPTPSQKAKYKRAITKIVESSDFFIMNSVWHKEDCKHQKVKAGQFHIGVQPYFNHFKHPYSFKNKKASEAAQQLIEKEFYGLLKKIEQAGLAKNCKVKTCYGGNPWMRIDPGIVMTPIFN
jgi:hypothetical protein